MTDYSSTKYMNQTRITDDWFRHKKNWKYAPKYATHMSDRQFTDNPVGAINGELYYPGGQT